MLAGHDPGLLGKTLPPNKTPPGVCTLKSEGLGSVPTALVPPLKISTARVGPDQDKSCQLKSHPCKRLASLTHSVLCSRLLKLVFPNSHVG